MDKEKRQKPEKKGHRAMAAPLRKEYTIDELEASYNEITMLYDYAGELVETVESQLTANPEAQLALVEPLIAELGDATDVLTEEYLDYADMSRRAGIPKGNKARLEGALRRIYTAINDYRTRVVAISVSAVNIADPIVNKIQRQVERVISIFVDFVSLSIASIMNKNEMELIRQRETRVAMMMHQMTMGQQG